MQNMQTQTLQFRVLFYVNILSKISRANMQHIGSPRFTQRSTYVSESISLKILNTLAKL